MVVHPQAFVNPLLFKTELQKLTVSVGERGRIAHHSRKLYQNFSSRWLLDTFSPISDLLVAMMRKARSALILVKSMGPVSIWSMEKLVWVQNYKLKLGCREILLRKTTNRW